MKAKQDQRNDIRFCVRSGMSQLDTINRITQIHGGHALSWSSIQRWFRRFQSGDMVVADKPRSGAPKKWNPGNIAKVRNVLATSGHHSIIQIATATALSKGTVHNILKKDLQLVKRPARWVPHHLTDRSKQRRLQMCTANQQLFQNDPTLIERLVTADESWIFAYDPLTKQGSMQWMAPGEVRPNIPRCDQSIQKVMLVCFFDSSGMIYRQFVPNGVGIDGPTYLGILIQFRESLRRRRPALWGGRGPGRAPNHTFVLQHDGAPAHHSNPVVNWIRTNRITVLDHPGYSPDLAACDYWLFDRVKSKIHGRIFNTIDDLQQQVDAVLNAIPQAEFHHAIHQLPTRIQKVIAAQGDYFE